MITPPAQPPTTLNTQQPAAQYQAPKVDLKDLADSRVGQFFKELKLRAYVQHVLAKNEQYSVSSGAAIVNMQTRKEIVSHNIDTEHFAASVNKVPIARLILADVRSGQLQFDQQLTWTAEDRRAGAGVFDQPDAPTTATVKDLLFDLLNPSGNTAVRVLVNQGMGGAAAVNERFKQELGLQHTYLQPLDANRFYVGNTTARESLLNIRELLAGNDEYKPFVKGALATNIYTDFGVRSQLAGNDYIVLANKVGILDDVEGNNRHDVGLIYNTKTREAYGFALLNTAPGEAYGAPTAQAGVSLADIGEAMLRFAGDKTKHLPVEEFRAHNAPQESAQRLTERLLY